VGGEGANGVLTSTWHSAHPKNKGKAFYHNHGGQKAGGPMRRGKGQCTNRSPGERCENQPDSTTIQKVGALARETRKTKRRGALLGTGREVMRKQRVSGQETGLFQKQENNKRTQFITDSRIGFKQEAG